jgi:hypothetical protein
MQLVPRELARQLEREQRPTSGSQDEDRERMDAAREQEKLELARVKNFCSSILKALAPPLLNEFEKATWLRADVEPFMPKKSDKKVGCSVGRHASQNGLGSGELVAQGVGFLPGEPLG